MASASHTFESALVAAPPIAAPDDVGAVEAGRQRDAAYVDAVQAAGGFGRLPFAARRPASVLRPAYM
jgi:hypothetical protein